LFALNLTLSAQWLATDGRNIFAGLNANGVWKLPLFLLTGIESSQQRAPRSVYPNPVKNRITISVISIQNPAFLLFLILTKRSFNAL
jgi:hypothetical protein